MNHSCTIISLDLLAAIVISFVEPSYTIAETGGQQRVCAELKSGNLRIDVVVQFSTSNGDAAGKLHRPLFPLLAYT